jgi:hypothetical protein
MKSRNDILIEEIDLTFIFVKGGPIDVFDETLTTLYTIQYTSGDYPINSIDFPNLTSITRNQNNVIENNNLTNINFPNLTDCYGFSIVVDNCDINLQSLTFSNALSFETLTASTINLSDLQEVNGILQFGGGGGDSPNTISLPSLIKVNNEFNVFNCNELTCNNLQYVGQDIAFEVFNTINDLDLSQLDYVGGGVSIVGSVLTRDIILTSLTQSTTLTINCASSSNIFLDNFVEVNSTFQIVTNAISLTFSNLIAAPQSFSIGGCNNLQSLSAPSLVDSDQIGISNNPNLTSIDISGLTNSNDFSISTNSSLTQSTFNNLIQVSGQISINNNSSLESISLNSLTTAGKIIIDDNSSLETIDLSSLDNIKVIAEDTGNDILYIAENNSNLKSLDISGLVTVIDGIISLVFLTGFPNLEEVILNNAVDATNVDITNANLTQTSVDNILVALDTAGYSGGTVDLSGGTSAAPSVGTGQPAVTSLQGKGWTVTTN